MAERHVRLIENLIDELEADGDPEPERQAVLMFAAIHQKLQPEEP